jgi:hypothetical protein
MNYLDNPMYPKDCIDYLVKNDSFQLTHEGFICDSWNCDDCPGSEKDIFCSVFLKRVPERQAVAALVVAEYPEYFI